MWCWKPALRLSFRNGRVLLGMLILWMGATVAYGNEAPGVPLNSSFAQEANRKAQQLSRQLKLTGQQAKKFIAVYREYWERTRIVRTRRRGILDGSPNPRSPQYKGEHEAIASRINMMRVQEKMLAKSLHLELAKFLPASKIVTYYTLTHERRSLLELLSEAEPSPTPPPPTSGPRQPGKASAK